MAYYEHVLIARQDISPQQAEALNEELKTLIEDQGGHIAKIEYWGLRNLTYRIKKNRKGHYSLLAIDAPAPAVKEMERQLSINEDVLRYLTVQRRGARPRAVADPGPPRPRARALRRRPPSDLKTVPA